MNKKTEILARFSEGSAQEALFLPDLSLWYEFHRPRGSLPVQWQDFTLPEIARSLGTPIWYAVAPYQVESLGVEIETTEQDGERVIRSTAPSGTLVARWVLGPDSEWWQTEYPVKTEQDLTAVLEIVEARSYVLDARVVARAEEQVGEDGVVVLEIPRRPYSDLLHEFLGWSEGLLFLRKPIIQQVNDILEAKLQQFVQMVAELPYNLVLSPDNLDGQFISPRAFRQYLDESYRQSADLLHQHNKRLVVHIGGPINHLLQSLVDSGVDGFEGICGQPQSDVTLGEARSMVGSAVTLWGGIPQDYLLQTHDIRELEAAIVQAVHESQGDNRAILGVADKVPVQADLERLEAIPALIRGAVRGK